VRLTVNSEPTRNDCIKQLGAAFDKHKYLRVTILPGKDRTIPQNNISHTWYGQIAKELREYDALGWKCFSKLHFGVPILRAENEEYRAVYDAAIKNSLSYEQKIEVMKFFPVTSEMTVEQLSKYLIAMQSHFAGKMSPLKFPVDA
jgi:hypothetical protein